MATRRASEVSETEHGVSPLVRRAVYAFLLTFALTGVAHVELWPFTGFRLFSEVRGDEREGWALTVVDHAGDEHGLSLADLPVAYRNTTRLLGSPEDREAERYEGACAAWADGARAAGRDVAAVRIYAVVSSVRPDGPPPVRTVVHECPVRR